MLKNIRKYRVYYAVKENDDIDYNFFDYYSKHNIKSRMNKNDMFDVMYKKYTDLFMEYKKGNVNIMQIDKIN